MLPWGSRYEGPDQVKGFFSKLTEHIDARVEVGQIIDAGDHHQDETLTITKRHDQQEIKHYVKRGKAPVLKAEQV